MTSGMRKTGLDVVGDMPWGTHFCLFYETRADLLETLVSYCKAGLESEEFCLWVVAEPLTGEDARHALEQAVPDLHQYLADHSIEIIAARDWYFQDGTFDLNRVINGWNEKLAHASARGYAGVRVTGDTAWLRKKDWRSFCEYEESLNQAVANQRLAVLCTYPLAACGAAEILDVVQTHQFAVTKRRGGWDVIETAGHKQAKAEIKRLNDELEQHVQERTRQLTVVNEELTKEILHRQRAEEALLRSEAYLTEAHRLSHTGSFAGTPGPGEIKWWSEECYRVLGFDPEEGLPPVETFFQRFHPDDQAMNIEQLERAARERTGFDYDFRIIHPGGEIRDIHTIGHPVFSPSGDLVEYVGTVIDITERKRAEALRDGESRILEMIARDAPLEEVLQNLVCVVEAQFAGLLCSVLLLDEDGQHVRHGAAPNLPQQYIKAIDGLCIGPNAGSCGTAMYRREPVVVTDILQDPLWEPYRSVAEPFGFRSCWSTPILAHSGKALGSFAMYYREPRSPSAAETRALEMATHLAGIAIERKLTDEQLQRSEAYLAEAQRLSHTGSWAFNTQKAIYWSEENFRIWGFNSERGLPDRETVLHRIHPEDCDRMLECVQNAVREKKDYAVDFRLVLPSGAVRYVHGIGHPVFSAGGELVEVVGTNVDVTERKRAEEERERLRQAQTDLAHINRVTTMGELAASLAHEIKQPITAAVLNARTCLRWLERDEPEVSEASEAASRLVTDVTRAADIISRISLLFKKGVLQHELVDVNELIREMIVLLRNEAARYSISIRSELGEHLPKVMGDRIQLQQVFMNVMLNAIDAMKDVGTARELTINSQRVKDGQLLVSVSDTGVGLPSRETEQIFSAFFSTKADGTGMGLPISRSIIESHGGRLWATSNSGRGATFHFTLHSELEGRHTLAQGEASRSA